MSKAAKPTNPSAPEVWGISAWALWQPTQNNLRSLNLHCQDYSTAILMTLSPAAQEVVCNYNEEAAHVLIAAQEVICNRNFDSVLFGREDQTEADDEQFLQCLGCMVAIPTDQSSRFCGPNCSGLGLGSRIKSLSINMGLSYLVSMSSLVKQSRLTPFGFRFIMMFLYDNHFGVNDLRTIWPKIEAEFVYRNPKLLKL